MSVYRLDGQVMRYDWGSPTVIPELLGLAADGRPVAELWMGAHAAAPSHIKADDGAAAPGGTLADLIAADPERLLGAETVARSGPTLPFLLKLLAVERPLSLQAHPSLAQAQAAFAAEDAAGLAPDSPERNYKDANHKPEMVCALTPFDGFFGFRPVVQTAEFWRALDVAGLLALLDRLLGDGGLRDVVAALLTMSDDAVEQLLAELVPAARDVADSGGAWAAEARWLVRLDEQYPGDRGVALTSLMNLVRLEPGESLFLASGQLHGYLHGTAVELMASSDNVLRGGLTSKRVDVAELLRILDFAEGTVEPDPGTQTAPGRLAYREHCPDFSLARLEVTAELRVPCPAGRAQILFCTSGTAQVLENGSAAGPASAPTTLAHGAAVFVPADDAVVVGGTSPASARVFVATTGGGAAAEPPAPR